MKSKLMLIAILIINFHSFSQEEVKLKNDRVIIVNSDGSWKYKPEIFNEGNFKDTRDGKSYKTINIGLQTWFAENLDYFTSKGSWCYDNKSGNCEKYGRLYRWKTAKKVCPSGWHLPSFDEWITLMNFLGGDSVAGGKLKMSGTTYWNSPNKGATNLSKFSALPGGSGYPYSGGYHDASYNDGYFSHIGEYGSWWSEKRLIRPRRAVGFDISYLSDGIGWDKHFKNSRYSVRCIKD